MFITIDGSSGSGKSTIINLVQERLLLLKYNVFITKEPTSRFSPSNEDKFDGKKLFNLILQDRETHLQQGVLPQLAMGCTVLCDRYIESSLVYQRIDGLSSEFIWVRNEQFLIPELSIIVQASEENIQSRLSSRSKLTRFEKSKNRELESQYFIDAAHFLQQHGFNYLFVENNDNCLPYVIDQIVSTIQKVLNEKTSIA